MVRQAYVTPVCRRLGSVKELTLASNFNNCDTPCGSVNNNDAFAPAS